MNQNDVEQFITEYAKSIFGFALKRCRTPEDAEDLAQEIALRTFRALQSREDIADPVRFLWTIAHNTLANYYRTLSRQSVGIPLDDVANLPDFSEEAETAESLARLRTEIAHLSRMQRQIVIAYYFENRKQTEIAEILSIPLGTVKWHLFEAKKELKRGMNTMRKASDLSFHPIRFHSYGVNGSVGTKSPDEFFRSALSQNICYCVRKSAKTMNAIADDLGVSPVYVESEVRFLAEYGFLAEQKDAYRINFLLSEPAAERLTLQNSMYKRAAELFANDLYDELTASGILDDPDLWCHQTDQPVSLSENPPADRNFMLWSLIPYIAACSGEEQMDQRISFEEAATIRPDGAQNIFHASVLPDGLVLPEDYVEMRNWFGPTWTEMGDHILWQVDSEWSDRGERRLQDHPEEAKHVLSLYAREEENVLTKEEYAWLTERGYVKTNGDYDGFFKASWQIVILASSEIKNRLLAIGNRIKERYRAEFEALKAPYAAAELEAVPPHLRKVRAYELQFVFHSDGWFLLHCITALLKNGRLKVPAECQRKALTTLILPR